MRMHTGVNVDGGQKPTPRPKPSWQANGLHRPPSPLQPHPGDPGHLEPTSSLVKWGTKVPKSDW